MADLSRIAGIVLAGGKSSRMGKNKALLEFNGQPLVSHMLNILHDTGLSDVFVSGSLAGYPCIEDDVPSSGPVQGIKSVLKKRPDYKGYLFVPVDMPLLSPEILRPLLECEHGGYFQDRPLPAYIVPPITPCLAESVQGFLDAQGIPPLVLPVILENTMRNANTPQEWNQVISAS